jgi:hypothetical protein
VQWREMKIMKVRMIGMKASMMVMKVRMVEGGEGVIFIL